jgi:hypothetical protein
VLLVGTAQDADLLERLAARLQGDGIDARAGAPASGADDPAAPLRESLEAARTLVVATSQRLLQAEWPWLEQASPPFGNSPDGDRRFVPLSLEECVLPETARRFRAVRWRPEDEKLLRLRFQDDLPIREIALRWGVEPAALHHEHARARQEFKAALLEVMAFHHPGPATDIEQDLANLAAALR